MQRQSPVPHIPNARTHVVQSTSTRVVSDTRRPEIRGSTVSSATSATGSIVGKQGPRPLRRAARRQRRTDVYERLRVQICANALRVAATRGRLKASKADSLHADHVYCFPHTGPRLTEFFSRLTTVDAWLRELRQLDQVVCLTAAENETVRRVEKDLTGPEKYDRAGIVFLDPTPWNYQGASPSRIEPLPDSHPEN